MYIERAALLHPTALRPPWHVAMVVAAFEMASHLLLTLALVAAGAVVVVLFFLLAFVWAPLAAAFVGWILWRSALDGAHEARRLARRVRRRARALGLRVVGGA